MWGGWDGKGCRRGKRDLGKARGGGGLMTGVPVSVPPNAKGIAGSKGRRGKGA